MSSTDPTINDDVLRSFLAEALEPREMAWVEKAVRDSATLRDRLEEIRRGGQDDRFHSLGAIWRRHRLTCPNRQQLGSYLMDAIEEDLSKYIRFHLEVVACPYCVANVDDLKALAHAAASAPVRDEFRARVFQSSRGWLGPSDG